MIDLTIELSYACLADCIMCARKQTNRKKIYMSVEDYSKYLRDVIDAGYDSIIFGGMGEPLLNPDFPKIVRLTRSLSSWIHIRLATTGCNMTGESADVIAEYIDEVKVSYYGFTKEIYEKVHRGQLDFRKITNNVLSLIERDRKCHITMNFLDLPINHGEYSRWKERFEKYSNVSYECWKPHNWGGNVNYEAQNRRFVGCDRVKNKNITIWSDGFVSACCFDVKRALLIGSLKEKNLGEILRSDEWKDIEKRHMDYKCLKGTVCANCDQIWDRRDCLIEKVSKKNILLILARGRGFGFFAEMRNALTGIIYAGLFDMEPHIYWGNNFGYRDSDNPENHFISFFEPVGCGLQEPKSEMYNMTFGREEAAVINHKYESSGYEISSQMMEKYVDAWARYIRLKDSLQEDFDAYWNKVSMGNAVMLGIHMRGADFRKGYEKHPVFVDVYDYLGEVYQLSDEIRANNKGIEIRIFVATDDSKMLAEFCKLVDIPVCYSNAKRTYSDETLYFLETEQKSCLCREVLLDAYILSKCQYLISGKSQVSYMAKAWKGSRNETYDKHIQIDKGLNVASSDAVFKHGNHKKTYYSLGGCDIQRCISFLSNDNTEIYFETSPFYGNARGMNTGTEYIRSCFDFTDEQKQFCIDHFSNYRRERAFTPQMFERNYDYVILTFSDDGLTDLWKAVNDPDLIIVGANKYGNPRVKYRINPEDEFEEFGQAREWFLDRFENIGRISMERLKENLSMFRDRLDTKTVMILMGGNECPLYRRGENHDRETIEQIKKINSLLREFSGDDANNSIYVDINDICASDDSFTDLVYHWTSVTAYRIAARIYERTAHKSLPLVSFDESSRNFHGDGGVYKPTLMLFGSLVSALKDGIRSAVGENWNVVENDMKCSLVSVCDKPLEVQIINKSIMPADIKKNVRKEMHRSDIEYVVLDHFYTAYVQKFLRLNETLFTYRKSLDACLKCADMDIYKVEQVDLADIDMESAIQQYIEMLNQQYGNRHIIVLGVKISGKSKCSWKMMNRIKCVNDEIDRIICRTFECSYYPEAIEVEIGEGEDNYQIVGTNNAEHMIAETLHRLTDGIR